MDSSKQFFDSVKQLRELSASFPDEIRKAKTPEEMQSKLQELSELAERITKPLEEIYGNLEQSFSPAKHEADAEPENDLLKAHPEWIESASAAKIYADLMPYINLELTENPKASNEPLVFVLAAAAKRARADGLEIPRLKAEDAAESYKKDLPRAIAKSVDTLHYPLDKPNSNIWGMLVSAEPNGQIGIYFDTTKKGDEPEKALVTYSINFDALSELDVKITKQLTPYDKRVYIAVAALWNGGNEIITATQIYKLMGNRGQPKSDDVQKIKDSILKMGAAWITIDNEKESAAYKNYIRFPYQGYLLPFEWRPLIINNMFTDAAIHLFREPPMISFAKQRKQITTIDQKVLESPISKTNANLMLEDYLLERIGRMKSEKGQAPNKILYSTLYEKCGITTPKQRSRLPEKVERYLKHYKNCKPPFITGYKLQKDGIIIDVS